MPSNDRLRMTIRSEMHIANICSKVVGTDLPDPLLAKMWIQLPDPLLAIPCSWLIAKESKKYAKFSRLVRDTELNFLRL